MVKRNSLAMKDAYRKKVGLLTSRGIMAMRGSDVDLAVKGARIDRRIINRISDDLNEEYPLPHFSAL